MAKNKFDLIKVVNPTTRGTQIYWYTSKNGTMISDSLSFNEEEAKDFYDKLISNSIPEKTEEIIQSIEIEYDEN
jgi:hypothetical protein